MGGRDKSRLPAPGGGRTLLERWIEVLAVAGPHDVVLVGGQGDGVRERVQDAPPGIGPLGGLAALLARAGERPVITVACDMPYVEPALLSRLASEHPGAAALAPRDAESGKWEALFARYDAAHARPVVGEVIASGRRSLQAVLDGVGAAELALDGAEREQLRDWDVSEDVEG